LQVAIGVEALAHANGHVDSLVNEIDAPIGHETMHLQPRMGGQKRWQARGYRGLESERAADPNKTARFPLHSERGFLGGFRLDHRRSGVLEDLTSNLGQTHARGAAVEQPHSESLLEQRNSPADAGLGHAQRSGTGGKAAILDHGDEELEIIEVAQHCPSEVPSVAAGYAVLFARAVGARDA
jgi:hypothetical protein